MRKEKKQKIERKKGKMLEEMSLWQKSSVTLKENPIPEKKHLT